MTEVKPIAPIEQSWFNRSVLAVAPDLIGCTIVRQFPDGQQLRGLIVETEAYQQDDPGCHGYRGKTPRTEVMFGEAGYAYVYLIYGMYHCLNVVTDRAGFASAVLIRALQLESMPTQPFSGKLDRLAAGPGKLCQVMQIDRSHNAQPLTLDQAIWVEGRSFSWQQQFEAGQHPLMQTTRIGLSQAQDLPWRWYLKGNPAVSKT
jgi:DNA-3-methyladenine glycosylase